MRVKNSAKNFNCFKASLKYFADKGIYLILINIIPAMLLPFVLSPSVTMYYLMDIDGVNTSKLGSLMRYMWNMPYEFWYIGIIGIIILVFTVAVTFGVIDRHMRVGEFTISPSRVKMRLNYNLLTSIKFVIVAFVALQFYNIGSTLLYYLWANVFHNKTLVMIFSCVTLCSMELSMIYTMSWVIIWPPFMLHTGMKSKTALKTAWSSMSGRLFQTVVSLATVVVPFQIVMVITGCLHLGTVCKVVLDAISYAIIVPYYLTVMYNTFYEVTGTERLDISEKKKSIWSKK